MASSSLSRSIQLATQNLWRNKLVTAATVLIMALILFIFNVIFTVNTIAQEAIGELKSKVDLILYLEDDADPLVVNQLMKDVEAFPESMEVTYTSKDDALEGLLEKYDNELNPFANDSLDNPLPASLQIITQTPEDHEIILTYIEQANYDELILNVESNRENRQIANNLLKVTDFSEKLLLGIILTFILGSLLIVANAIYMTIFHRKKEIQIMQIVGADLNFIRSPFLIEGAIYGILSVIISMVLLILFVNRVDLSQITFINAEPNYHFLFWTQGLVAIVIGMLSSHLALRYYMKNNRAL
jgi:cell division transport system permease protein